MPPSVAAPTIIQMLQPATELIGNFVMQITYLGSKNIYTG
jgi:hypothetical protein